MSLKVSQQERQKYEFYGGEVTLEYDPIDHVYLKDGIEIPSVTTIVKIIDKSAALINWAVKLTVEKILASVHFPVTESEFQEIVLAAKSAHREKLESAGNIGKIAHSYIEEWIKFHLRSDIDWISDLPEGPAGNCCKAAFDWMSQHQVRWICTERKIYSQVFDYAGTLDGIAYVSSCQDRSCCPVEFKDRLSLIDWKSSNQLYNEYLFQTAAYCQAYEEETDSIIEDRWVIRLGKDDGEFEAWHLEDGYQEDFLAFEHCLELTNLIKSVNLKMKERKKKRGKNGRKTKSKIERQGIKEEVERSSEGRSEAPKAIRSLD